MQFVVNRDGPTDPAVHPLLWESRCVPRSLPCLVSPRFAPFRLVSPRFTSFRLVSTRTAAFRPFLVIGMSDSITFPLSAERPRRACRLDGAMGRGDGCQIRAEGGGWNTETNGRRARTARADRNINMLVAACLRAFTFYKGKTRGQEQSARRPASPDTRGSMLSIRVTRSLWLSFQGCELAYEKRMRRRMGQNSQQTVDFHPLRGGFRLYPGGPRLSRAPRTPPPTQSRARARCTGGIAEAVLHSKLGVL